MHWKITTGSDRASANVQSFTGVEGRPVFVDVTHPGTGPDATVEIIDVSTLKVVASTRCGFTDQGPKRVSFSPIASGSRSYNLRILPIGADFGTGIDIIANETSAQPEVPFSYNPSDGTTQFPGDIYVKDPRSGLYVSSSPRGALEAGLGVGLMCGIWGSSSDRRCATNDVNLTTETSSANGTAEYCDAWWRHMLTRFGAQFSLAWNGAVAGDVWAQTEAKIASDFAGGNVPHLNFAFVRPGANDLANGATAASISASIRAAVETHFLARGIRVVLITSHTNNPLGSAVLAEYDNLAAFFDQMALDYPGLVMHANTFAQFGRGVTPLSSLLDSQHLNEEGTETAAGAFKSVVRAFGRPCASTDPWDYGEVVMEIDPNNTTGLATASATQASGTVDADKKKRILLTGTANGGRIVQANMVSGKTLAAGDLCRLWCDVTPEAGASTSNIYMAGVGLRNGAGVTDSKRFGTYSSGSTYGPQLGNRIRGLSRIFTIPTSLLTVPQLYATSGAGTNSVQVGRCALIRVKKAGT